MRTLLIGKDGQVGSALLATLAPLGELVALDRPDVDITRPDSLVRAVRDARPQVIVNAAAYTAVDQAEQDQALAFQANRDAPAILAEEAQSIGARLVHYSTDYVFDGKKPAPYVETDAPNPLNAYGRSKLAGDQAIQASRCRHLIFRTSWVYSNRGNNFMLTMLRLAREGKRLRVVDDQIGAPTTNLMLARATAAALNDENHSGLYHMTAGGEVSWYGFAQAIFQALGIRADLSAIPSSEYKTPAKRPRNSVLDNAKLHVDLNIRMPDWESGLRETVQALR